MKLLDHPIIARTRRNHAIEHATVHILSEREPSRHLVGRTTAQGFLVYGLVTTELLRRAVEDALCRLQAGEASLAVHPNCGTNLATAGVLTGVAALVASNGRRRSFFWERLPSAVLAATAALFLAQPLGYLLQERVTTMAQVADVRIGRIVSQDEGRFMVHQVNLIHGETVR